MRWRSSAGDTPRKMLTSMGSRSSTRTSSSTAAWGTTGKVPAGGGGPRVPEVGDDLDFPDGFVWGTATAAHQIEGGNWNNDWWAWEHDPASGCAEPSGDACDSWNRWEDDVALVGDLGLSTYRFSVEWS